MSKAEGKITITSTKEISFVEDIEIKAFCLECDEEMKLLMDDKAGGMDFACPHCNKRFGIVWRHANEAR